MRMFWETRKDKVDDRVEYDLLQLLEILITSLEIHAYAKSIYQGKKRR